ncbi:MAG: phosphomannomutase [Selenomonadaceae bacterium]|nr:phosphomannomutase [Selenomonadaceae bacterium]
MAIDVSGFGAYDVRGIYPKTINQELAYRVGRVFPELFGAKKIAIGHDIRLSGPTISDALARGLSEAGADVFDIGECGTEMIYFTTGFNDFDGGIMITASHNPQEYNGMKFVGKGVRPIGPTTGMNTLRDKLNDESYDWTPRVATGTITKIDVMRDYIKCLLSYVDVDHLKPFKIVVNTGNGAAGTVINELEKVLPFKMIKVHNDPNGFFPNGVPNPLLPDARHETAKVVVDNGAACGIAFDGDFDRCFMFDEEGGFIEGYYMVGLLAQEFLSKNKGAKIVYEPRVIWNTEEIVDQAGGERFMCRSGHTYMKTKLREVGGVYGGEMASHHYFRDFYFCDSGMIPWLLVLELMSQTGKTLSSMVEERQARFPISGEVNTKVSSVAMVKEIMDRIEAAYAKGGEVDHTDGVSINFADWRFNLRGSQTEPYIRLNVETRGNAELLKQKTEELLKAIRNA